MVTRIESEKRNRLSYLALYLAIQGDRKRSEQIRREVRRIDSRIRMRQEPAYDRRVAI